jgi:hypothetical protein
VTGSTWADVPGRGRVWIATLAQDATIEIPKELLGIDGLAGEAVLREGQRVPCIARLAGSIVRVEITCDPEQLRGARFEAVVPLPVRT